MYHYFDYDMFYVLIFSTIPCSSGIIIIIIIIMRTYYLRTERKPVANYRRVSSAICFF